VLDVTIIPRRTAISDCTFCHLMLPFCTYCHLILQNIAQTSAHDDWFQRASGRSTAILCFNSLPIILQGTNVDC